MTHHVSIVLVGIGGYGNTYVSALLDKTDPATFTIAGVVDPFADRSPRIADLKARGLPFFDTLSEFYSAHVADLAVISSPIHLHTPQTCEALSNGSAVLCEKPLGATIQEVRHMIQARDKAELFVGIGYQWSFSAAIQSLKQDILDGHLGKPLRLKTLVLWPRNEAYYGRNNWAGAMQDDQQNWILDSPVNNATAHYLHNMFYVIGSAMDRSAVPLQVQAELYRANNITNYDTAAARVRTAQGAEILFYASHAVEQTRGPEFVYEFEKATVRFPGADAGIVAAFTDASMKEYGNPNQDVATKLWDAMKAVRGEKQIVCGPEAAGMQTLCMNGMQESASPITDFPENLIETKGESGKRFTYVSGLDTALTRAFETNSLPGEMGVPWAVGGKPFELQNYTDFPA